MKVSRYSNDQTPGPQIDRVRHELKFRLLQVVSVDRLTPGMLRINFCGEDLSDFVSLAPDDHVKIFMPTSSGEYVGRSYTPRGYDSRARTLAIDFALHDAGPATHWALNARPGDTLRIRGPKGSSVIASDIRRWLLIGDETALPAIGRRIEEATSGTHITSIVSVVGANEHQAFETAADLTIFWAHRPLLSGSEAGALLAIIKTIDLEAETFVWIAAEAAVARAIRTHFIRERNLNPRLLKAAGYWIAGKADAHEKFN